jgi:TolB protein
MKFLLSRRTFVASVLLAPFARRLHAAEVIEIDRVADAAKVIPISLSGFNGVAQDVLRFDLEVLGFSIVAPDQADFHLSGKNSGNQIEGRLANRAKVQLFARAFEANSTRSSAHALANDVVSAIRRTPPIFHSRIAFRVETASNKSEIYVADFDGFGAAPITADNSNVSAPCWVPGQNRLFYTSYRSGFPDILSHDVAAGKRQVFARYPGSNFSPAVSPDGRQVAMILSRSGSPDLYVDSINGGSLRQLTKTKEDESSPTWSPDGRTICFVSRHGGRAALFTVPAGGGEMRRLNVVGVVNATEPDWSPDGKWIVFTSMMGGFNVCVVPAQGGEATILVAGEDPAWAANSRTVMFTRRIGGRRVLSLLDVPTKRVKDVRQISGSSSQPSWAK